ncbi:MAG TPA: helix-turn-helix domain-containing protein [Kiritimatiellia bacterium]|nr:helix-turn-helix domain-containing protein [Kiritimatiellia bacterium]HRZ11571.1 helix-turn-helix domain-containing protein [Kiritimatiellia bacterium]HSA16878.1 helix-turn-helix domain-containing protein [Kiritimatiellia bacterium]
MELHPTMWRTCRVLAGPTRLRLLRQIIAEPGLPVSGLADRAALKLSRASQELRRLSSRELVQAVRQGREVRYRPYPDPQVPSASPLLAALTAALRRGDAMAADCRRVAAAFSHPRRIAIVRELLRGPRPAPELAQALPMHSRTLYRHLRWLKHTGTVKEEGARFLFVPDANPLLRCIVRLLHRQRE